MKRKFKSKYLYLLILPLLFSYLLFEKKYEKEKIILIGIDGAEWKIINSLITKGKVPNFAEIKKKGASGRIASIYFQEGQDKYPTSYISPLIWTSIATGRSPQEHKIVDFYINGEVCSTKHRKVPAFWNILSNYNKSSAIIGWPCTYPAENIFGSMIAYGLSKWKFNVELAISIDEYNMLNYKELFYPEILKNKLKGILSTNFKVKEFYENKIGEITCCYKSDYYYYLALMYVIWHDEMYFRILNYFLKKGKYDLVAVYFDGIDLIQHDFWLYTYEDLKKVLNDYNRKCKDEETVENYYILMDKRIGEIYKNYKDKYTIIIVSDHGGKFYPYNQQYYNHSEYGIFIIVGKGIKKNYTIPYPYYNHYDILPTLLYIMDVPISKELKGRIMKRIFNLSYLMNKREKWVDKYIERKEIFDKKYIDPEMKEKLKGLGYVQ